MGLLGYLCRPLINKPPPINRDYNRDPNIKALKRGGVINHGSTLFLVVVPGHSKGSGSCMFATSAGEMAFDLGL